MLTKTKSVTLSNTDRSDGWPKLSVVESPHFNLVRWFGWISFASIAIVSAASAILLTQFLTNRLLIREAQIMTEIVNSIVNVEREDQLAVGQRKTDWLRGDMQEFFTHLGGLPDVLRANVYLPNNTIAWSTDVALIDRKFGSNEELEEAFSNGLPKIKMGTVGANKKTEHVFLGTVGQQFIESYLPIFGEGENRNRVVAIAEIYRAPKILFEVIEQGVIAVWVSAAVAAGFIFFSLFWIVRRAATVMRRQQQQIVESEMLAAVGEMASAVAHSLRNPLASIRSSAELGLENLSKDSVADLLRNIIQDSDRLESWVRQYLTQVSPEKSVQDEVLVAAAIDRSLQAFSTELARRDIRISVDIPTGLPAVGLNSFLIMQILNGLVANAVEETPDGGEIGIKAEFDQRAQKVRIEIKDNGPGLSKDQADTVFKPFITSKTAGLGLGLPLARRIVRRHDGNLTLTNRVEGGAVATIVLPMAGSECPTQF